MHLVVCRRRLATKRRSTVPTTLGRVVSGQFSWLPMPMAKTSCTWKRSSVCRRVPATRRRRIWLGISRHLLPIAAGPSEAVADCITCDGGEVPQEELPLWRSEASDLERMQLAVLLSEASDDEVKCVTQVGGHN